MGRLDAEASLRPEDLAELCLWLKRHDFRIAPQQALAAARLVSSALPHAPLTELWRWLSPIFCTTAAEQHKFQGLYHQWLRASGTPTGPTTSAGSENEVEGGRPPRRFPWAGALTLSLFLVLAADLFWQMQPLETQVLVRQGQAYLQGARVRADRGAMKQNVLRYRRWDLPVTLQVSHPSVVTKGQLSVVSKTLNRFARSVEIDMPSATPAEPAPEPLVTSVGQRVATLPAAEPVEVVLLPTKPKFRLDPLLALLYAAMVLIPSAWWWITWMRRRGFLERLPDRAAATFQLFAPARTMLLAYAAELRYLGREMRRRRKIANRDLDVASTLAVTVQSGIPRMLFGSRAEPEYVFLVDGIDSRDHQGRLAAEIVTFLVAQGVSADRYGFQNDPRYSFHVPVGGPAARSRYQSLSQLFERHPDSRLIILSDGSGLIDRYTGRPQTWMPLLLQWSSVVLMTPQPRDRWNRREWLLDQAGLAVLPMNGEGIHQLGEVFRGGLSWPRVDADARDRVRPSYMRDVDLLIDSARPGTGPIDALLADLQGDLGSDGIRWLTACAIYPEMHWPMTLAVGEALFPDLRETSDGAPREDVRRTTFARTLGQLVRLPWLRQGNMPDWLREALLQRANPADEEIAREAVEGFLASVAPKARTPAGQDELAVSEGSSGALADFKRGVAAWWKGRPLPERTEDRIFLRFMSARPRLAVAATDALSRLFYKNGTALGGPFIWPVVAVAATVCALAFRYPPVDLISQQGEPPIVVPKPVAIAIDQSGRRFVFTNDVGPVSFRSLNRAGIAGLMGCKLAMPPVIAGVIGDTEVNLAVRDPSGLALATLAMPSIGAQGCDVDTRTKVLPTFVATSRQITSGSGRDVFTISRRKAEPNDSNFLCASLVDGELTLFGREFLQPLPFLERLASSCAVSGDGRNLVVGTERGQIFQIEIGPLTGFQLDVISNDLFQSRSEGLPESRSPVTTLATDRVGRAVGIVRLDGSVWLQGAPGSTWNSLGLSSARAPIAFSGDGRTLAITNDRQQTELWSIGGEGDRIPAPEPGASAPKPPTVGPLGASIFKSIRYEAFACPGSESQAVQVMGILRALGAGPASVAPLQLVTLQIASQNFAPSDADYQVRFRSDRSDQASAVRLLLRDETFSKFADWRSLPVARKGEKAVRFLVCSRRGNAATPAVDFPASAPTSNAAARSLYATYCGVCHDKGVAGAPKLGDKADWAGSRYRRDRRTDGFIDQGEGSDAAAGRCAYQQCRDALDRRIHGCGFAVNSVLAGRIEQRAANASEAIFGRATRTTSDLGMRSRALRLLGRDVDGAEAAFKGEMHVPPRSRNRNLWWLPQRTNITRTPPSRCTPRHLVDNNVLRDRK